MVAKCFFKDTPTRETAPERTKTRQRFFEILPRTREVEQNLSPSLIHFDERLTLEKSVFEFLCGGKFTSSTQLINPNFCVVCYLLNAALHKLSWAILLRCANKTHCGLFSGGNGLYFVHLIKTLETAVPKLVFLRHFHLRGYILVAIRNESVSMLAYICHLVY